MTRRARRSAVRVRRRPRGARSISLLLMSGYLWCAACDGANTPGDAAGSSPGSPPRTSAAAPVVAPGKSFAGVAPVSPPELASEAATAGRARTAADRKAETDLVRRRHPWALAKLDELRKHLAQFPGSAEAHAALGSLLVEVGLDQLAERELLAAVSLNDGLDESHLALADLSLLNSWHGRAVWHLQRAERSLGSDPRLVRLKASLARRVGEAELADELVRGALDGAPRDVGLLVLAGRLALDADRADEALVFLERAAKRAPEHRQLHMLMGQAQSTLGQTEAAEDSLVQHGRLLLLHKAGLLDRQPPVSEAWKAAVLANHHLDMGALESARQELERSFGHEAGNPEARTVRARLAVMDGDEAGARAELEALLTEDPASARALCQLSLLLSGARDASLRDPERAVSLASAALSHRGRWEDVEAFFALGTAHAALNEVPAARRALERALVLAPEHRGARLALAALERDAADSR